MAKTDKACQSDPPPCPKKPEKPKCVPKVPPPQFTCPPKKEEPCKKDAGTNPCGNTPCETCKGENDGSDKDGKDDGSGGGADDCNTKGTCEDPLQLVGEVEYENAEFGFKPKDLGPECGSGGAGGGSGSESDDKGKSDGSCP